MPDLDNLARPYAEALVATLKQEGSLTQPLVEAAFHSVPRHAFLDCFFRRERHEGKVQIQEVHPSSFPSLDGWLRAIYTNQALTISYSPDHIAMSSSSSPDAMAYMLEALDLTRGLRVLEIGTGTGYNAALLASIVGDRGYVWTVEVDPDLAQAAARRLAQVPGSPVSVHIGNGLEGYASGAPYDRIVVTGSTSMVPLPWLKQVRTGGIILMNLIGEMGACSFLKLVKQEKGFSAGGHFLSRSEFMELYESGAYPHRRATLLGEYIGHPITLQTVGRYLDFDLSALWERKLDMALQLAFPQMFFTSAYASPPCPCLIDQATETMLLFRPCGEGLFQVEVRGNPVVWEKLKATYQQWIAAGRPDITAYHMQIEASGKQSVILPSFAGATREWTWVIYNPN